FESLLSHHFHTHKYHPHITKRSLMHVTVDTTEGFSRRMRVEIPEDAVTSVVNERLQSLIPTTVIPGFRPGKAPLKLIAHRYGVKMRAEVVEKMVFETFQQAAMQEKLFLATEPQFTEVNADPGQGINYSAVFEVYPDFQLPAIETLEIQRPVAEVTDSDVDRVVETLRGQSKTWAVVDRPAAEGDRVLVDFEGVIGQKPQEDSADQVTDDAAQPEGDPAETTPAETLKGTELPIELGMGKMIDGFEAGLIGTVADDERVLELKYPSDYYRSELADRPVTFTVRVRSVEESALLETDEDFAKHLGIEDGNIETIRTATREDLVNKLEFALRVKTNQKAIDALLEKIGKIELPGSIVKREATAIAQKRREEFKGLGLDPDTLGISSEKSESQAELQLTVSLLFGKLMALSKLTPDADKVRERIESMASSYQEPKQMIAWYYEDENRLASVQSAVLQDQMIEWVLERANVTEERMSLDEVLNQYASAPATSETDSQASETE
ncbi:MAG: trigger factor, partial [Gammaproteobacteria bacterium]|nr:trigger factor [Gammaproteobacteria bacterium]